MNVGKYIDVESKFSGRVICVRFRVKVEGGFVVKDIRIIGFYI